MPKATFSHISISKILWQTSPIPVERIKDGTPVARIAYIFGVTRASASAMIWDCTAGTFDWHFANDETIQILEGEVRIMDAAGHLATLRTGEFGFFPAGSVSTWHIDRYVCKLAFERQSIPAVLAAILRATSRMWRLVSRLG